MASIELRLRNRPEPYPTGSSYAPLPSEALKARRAKRSPCIGK